MAQKIWKIWELSFNCLIITSKQRSMPWSVLERGNWLLIRGGLGRADITKHFLCETAYRQQLATSITCFIVYQSKSIFLLQISIKRVCIKGKCYDLIPFNMYVWCIRKLPQLKKNSINILRFVFERQISILSLKVVYTN